MSLFFDNQRELIWLMVILVFLFSVSGCSKTMPPGANIVSAKVGDTSYTLLHWQEAIPNLIPTLPTRSVHRSTQSVG